MKKFWINFRGCSMSPLLQDGDVILIEEVVMEDLKCGDIILFFDQENKLMILHRLLDFSAQTKGDFSFYSENTSFDNYFGRAIQIKRNEQYITLPSKNSMLNLIYLKLSKLRMRGCLMRKLAYLGLLILTIIFEFCSDKTKPDHREWPMKAYP